MDSYVRFLCPTCGRRVKTASANAGKEAVCSCGEKITVPWPAEETAPEIRDLRNGLSSSAIEIATNKPRLWEYRLFGQVIVDECERIKNLPRTEVPAFVSTVVNLPDFGSWMSARIKEIGKVSDDAASLMNANHEEAFGLPGRPGDVQKIVALSKKLANYYRLAVEWVHQIELTRGDSRCLKVTREMTVVARQQMEDIERFGRTVLSEIDKRLLAPPGAPPVTIALTFEAPDLSRCYEEQRRFYDEQFRFCEEQRLLLEKACEEQRLLLEEEKRLLIDSIINDAALSAPAARPHAGYLYLLVNPSMEGLIKVGKTVRNPRERAKELGSATGVPTPFILVFDLYVEDCARAEEHVHTELEQKGYRVSENREFFSAPSSEAIKIMLQAQKLVASGEDEGQQHETF